MFGRNIIKDFEGIWNMAQAKATESLKDVPGNVLIDFASKYKYIEDKRELYICTMLSMYLDGRA